ncbi:MepB family protein [Streptomyces botrytidirepellens]|uniref:MepB family protein n=1 Tax=Streptomyces botrytidirepellens TaxID=2486417 RepID=UPI00319DBC17
MSRGRIFTTICWRRTRCCTTRVAFVAHNPRDVLCEHGIVSRGGSGGKRGFRVYPPWVTTTNRQASRTQAWQTKYFLDFTGDGSVDMARARVLYSRGSRSSP